MPSTKLYNFTVEYPNQEEFHSLKREIFGQDSYHFETDNPAPRIIDIGAHLGLSVLYFKHLYPLAKIDAYEPNYHIFPFLERNIFENRLEQDVTLYNLAIAPEAGEVRLFEDENQEWLSNTSILPNAWNGQLPSKLITAPAVTLSSLLTEPIDLLKLDIEGQEQAVLKEARNKLKLASQIIFEFHPHPTQSLRDLSKYLTNLGFGVEYFKNNKQVTIHQARGLSIIKCRNLSKK